MRQIIFLILLSISIISCSPTTKYSDSDPTNKFVANRYMQNQNRKVALVSIQNEKNEQINTAIYAIGESEFTLSGFEVLERKQFPLILNEIAFSESIANDSLQQLFPSATEVAQITITKNKKYDWLDFYLVYNKYVAVQEIRVDIKLINTQTGRIQSVYGEGKTEISSSTVMLVFGTWQSKSDELFEETLRIAIRNAINKIQ